MRFSLDRVFVGRDAAEADKSQRIRITPLPSIGHPQTERSIRRVLVAVPPDCPIAAADIAWAFSGLVLDFNPETGEAPPGAATLVTADDRSMLDHYGVDSDRKSRLWRTVTPAALPERAARRRIDPGRMREEAKGGAERTARACRGGMGRAPGAAPCGRHRACDSRCACSESHSRPKGSVRKLFAPGTRFAKERLWHVEIAFAEPASGPLIIGDGRYLGLGLMAPVRRTEGVFAFDIAGGLAEQADQLRARTRSAPRRHGARAR